VLFRSIVRQVIDEFLGAAHRVRAAAGDFAGHVQGDFDRVVGQAGDEAKGDPFGGVQDAPGEDEVFHHVVAHEAAQHERARHVGDQPPVHLAHRQLRVGVRDTNVGAECQLHAAAEGVTAQGGNYWHRHFLPHPADLLGEVRDAVALHRADDRAGGVA